ncbi:LOW QUALITY PROTEIN: cytosolic 5'-nucleotidase 1A-like [Aegotheles albertisi]
MSEIPGKFVAVNGKSVEPLQLSNRSLTLQMEPVLGAAARPPAACAPLPGAPRPLPLPAPPTRREERGCGRADPRGGGCGEAAAPLPHKAGAADSAATSARQRRRLGRSRRAGRPGERQSERESQRPGDCPERGAARPPPTASRSPAPAPAAPVTRSPAPSTAAPGTMSGSGRGPEAPQPSDGAEVRLQEAEQDWAAAKAFCDNLVSKRPRPPKPQNAITVAVSSRALFDLVEEWRIYEEQGVEKLQYQQDNENVTLKPRPAFYFVRALQHVNARLLELYPDDEERFDIVLMTNNHAQVGVRLINSINHYSLTIERLCMTGGESPIGYLTAYLVNLYLSADSEKVQEAIEAGIAAATMFTANRDVVYSDTQLRVAFDGDAVLFSDESEQIVKEQGLDRFFENEQLNENKPLAQGPLKGFLEDLGKLQKKFYAKNERLNCPIRTFLVTARSAASSEARVLKTLRSWGLEIDEALFLEGAPKGPILVKIRPHIFFDDQMFHIEGAQKLGTIAAHVPYGVAQKYHKSA